jgi:hypothetical protein
MIQARRWLCAAASLAVALASSVRAESSATGASASASAGAATEASAEAGGRAGPGAAPSAVPLVPVLRPEEQLLLQVRTDKWILDEAFTGYSTPTGVYLPLGDFARLLDLAIDVDGDNGRAEGWFIDPANIFRIDIKGGFVETREGRRPLKPGDAVAALGDIYVRPAVLSEWFPLQVEVSLPRQQVQLKLLATFPFEAKMERAEKRGLIGAGTRPRVAYPREATLYRMMTTPALDVNLRATTGQGQQSTSEYDVRASGDLAFMNADLFVTGNRENAVSDMRFVMRRRDPDRQMLGPLGLSLIEVGDTSSAAEPIGVRTRTGRGIVIGNLPIDQGSVFEKIDMRGELPIGYEVELYRNDVLIGSVDHGVNGRYEFLQVPLEYGLNVLRLVFYGPHGERREEVRQVNAGEGRLAKGEFHFAASAIQQDKNLIPIHADNVPAFGADAGEIRAVAAAQYGLSSRVTAVAGLASFTVDGKRRLQGNAGIRTNLGSAAMQVDAAFQGNGAWALQSGLAGRLLGTSYVLQHTEYGGDFVDELRSTIGTYRRDTQLRLDRAFNLGSRSLATNLVAERSEHDGATDWNATFRASTSVSRWLISNSFNYRRFKSDNFSSENLDGTFELNGALRDWGVRAAIDYFLEPGSKLRDFNLALDRNLGRGALLRFTVFHQLSEGHATIAGVSLSRRVGAFDMGGDLLYDSGRNGLVVGVRASFSFGNPLGAWRFEPPGLARGGSLVAVAFRDLNGDGIQEPGEPPLQGIGFRGGAGEVSTNSNGMALVTGLGDGRPSQVSMITDSLPDPYMFPSRPGVEIVPRPGRTHRSLFPVVAMSEFEGHAYFEGGEARRAVSNVQLQLVNSKGIIVASVRTEYDGYFFIERIPPGEYRIRIDPDQAAKLNIRLAREVPVTATPEGGLVGKLSVNIARRGAAPSK